MAISLLTGILVAVVGNAILPGAEHRPSDVPTAGPGAGPTGTRTGVAGNAAAAAVATATAGGGGSAVGSPAQPGSPTVAGAAVDPGTGTTPGVGAAAPANALANAPANAPSELPSEPPSELPSINGRPTPARPASAGNGPARLDRERGAQPSGAQVRATPSSDSGAAGQSAAALAVAQGGPVAAGASGSAGAPGGASPPTAAAVEPDKNGDKLAGRSADASPEEIPEAAKDAAKETSPETATKDNKTRDKTKDKAEEKLSAGDEHAAPDCSLPDKDIAREAWRRNWPTLCKGAEADRVSLFIPLKGTLDGETHELRPASREVRINLPAGESLLTLRQYKVRRSGFKDLRIFPTDSGGTRLRLKLSSGTGEPSFDMKDGYAKITITAPRSASTD